MQNFSKDEKLVLDALYKLHYHIFNPEDIPASLRILSQETKIHQRRIKDICRMLKEEDYIEIIENAGQLFYRITSKGIKKIENKLLDKKLDS